MSAAVGVRGGAVLSPPVLSTSFRSVSADGEVGRSGYLYAIYLPDAVADGVKEQAGGGMAAGVVDPDLAETTWCAYAWPANFGNSGNRSFFVSQAGDNFRSLRARLPEVDQGYSGPNGGPDPEAAFTGAGTAITGNTASGATGRDGNFWRAVG